MNEQIKTQITTSYMMFVFEFADPSSIDEEKLTDDIRCNLNEIFSSQKNADRAKRILGKDNFSKLLSVYFNKFQSGGDLNFIGLEDAIAKNKKVMMRHLGRDKVTFLNLIVTLMKALELEPNKKGLLWRAC